MRAQPAQSTGDGQIREPMIVHCGSCEHEWAPVFLPAPVDVVTKAMKVFGRCPMCQKGGPVLMGLVPRATGDGDWRAWMHNGDTGTSSETIWSVMTKCPVKYHGAPSDPADFGRCYRLLKVMPSWRPRLSEVAGAFPNSEWPALVKHWDELTTLYERDLPTGTCKELYNRMRELRGEKAVT